MSLGVVFAGGGTRGSYHLGAYKALVEMGKKPDMIAGTSIGAINGAAIAQGDFDRLMQVWDQISLYDVVKTSEELKSSENLFDIKNMSALVKELYQNRGIDVTPLKNLIEDVIDEAKLRESAVDFGLVTFSVTDKKEIMLTKSEIPEGKLVDYLLASSCFIGFKLVKIDNSLYMDGGVSNNLPLNMLIQRDMKDIVAIDVGGVGIVKSANESGRNIITVRSKEPAVGILDFREEDIKKNISYGYFDTMRAFGKCVGDRYYIETSSYYRARELYSSELLSGVEKAAEVFEADPFKIYKMDELIEYIVTEYRSRPKESRLIEKIMNLNEKNIVCSIAQAMITENDDFLSSKIVSGLLGTRYEAADAIAYFSR